MVNRVALNIREANAKQRRIRSLRSLGTLESIANGRDDDEMWWQSLNYDETEEGVDAEVQGPGTHPSV